MRKIVTILIMLILTGCYAQKAKAPEPLPKPAPIFVPPIQTLPYTMMAEGENEPSVEAVEVKEEPESSVFDTLVSHMIEHDLPKEKAKEYAKYIVEASNEYSVDPITVLSIIHVETNGTFRYKNKPNSKGAIGLMQILKSNAGWMGVEVEDLYDPKTNIMLGTKYLKYLQDRFGEDLGITAYNQGEGNVERGTYRTWYFKKVDKVYKSIKTKESSPDN